MKKNIQHFTMFKSSTVKDLANEIKIENNEGLLTSRIFELEPKEMVSFHQ